MACRVNLSRIAKLSLLILTALPLSILPALPAVAAPAPTSEGTYIGSESLVDQTITVYRGIPYAVPPIGHLRWQPPRPQASFNGEREAIHFGAPCWQPIVAETSIYSRGQMDVSEDCLYLNIWTRTKNIDPAPVLVWFHGGGNTTGHAHSKIFDGSRLAAKGAVIVTANYRLGAMGFMAHPALTQESAQHSSGNYGLLDQIMVLKWVHQNIAAFGGDPTRVTIFGQSAGALDVCLLMASPLAKDLFRGVIAHSGGCMNTREPLQGPDSGQARGVRVAEHLGITGADNQAADRLRDLSPAAISEAQTVTDTSLSAPIVDGWVIPAPPMQLFSEGRYNRARLISGVMADEYRGLGGGIEEVSDAAYTEQIKTRFGEHGEAILDAYAPISRISTAEALRKIATHSFFAWESRTMARLITNSGGQAWVYHFSYPTMAFRLYIPERPEFPVEGGDRALGAFHSGDLAYHFATVGVVGEGWTQTDHALADQISDYWINFAASGDPNGSGLADWPGYQSAADQVMEFTQKSAPTTNPLSDKLDLFDQIHVDRLDPD